MRILLNGIPDPIALALARQAAVASQESKIQAPIELLFATGYDALAKYSFAHVRHLEWTARKKVDWKSAVQLRRIVKQFRPDIIHAFYPRSLAVTNVALLGLPKKPSVISYYGITRVPSRFRPDDWLTYLNPTVAYHACESHAVRHALTEGGIHPKQCEVVYNVVKPAVVSDRTRLRREWNIAPEDLVIGTVANIRPVKGIDILLQCLIQSDKLSKAFVVLAGEIHDEKVRQLLTHPKLQGRVRTLGFVQNPAAVASAMDIFVMPSRKEALCQALVEAMQQRICCVASRAGGMAELIRDRIDGRSFPVEDTFALQSILEELSIDTAQRNRLAELAVLRARELCGPETVAARLMALYFRAYGDSAMTRVSSGIPVLDSNFLSANSQSVA